MSQVWVQDMLPFEVPVQPGEEKIEWRIRGTDEYAEGIRLKDGGLRDIKVVGTLP